MIRRSLFLTMLAALVTGVLATGCPKPYNLGYPGPYAVQYYITEFEPGVPISIFCPAPGQPVDHAPVVLIHAGWNQPRGSYEGYAMQLAQWGYVAIIRSYPTLSLLNIEEDEFLVHVDQSARILDWVAQEAVREGSPLHGLADASTAGATGHSMGAGVAMRTALLDPRVKAAVSLDSTFQTRILVPYQDLFATTDAAMMYIAAAEGGWCARPPYSEGPLFDLTSPPAAEVAIEGADHMDFEDTPVGFNHLGNVACPRGWADAGEVRAIASRYMIAWFNVHLKDIDSFSDVYGGKQAQQDEEEGLVRVRLKLDSE